MRARPVVSSLAIGLLLLLAAAGIAVLWHPAIAPAVAPERASFSADQVSRGRTLATLGFCSSCHSKSGEGALSGGRALVTPFGTIYSTNITPDPETGIGPWPLQAFTRAMREGVDREGRQLYPAFPYNHFTHLTDTDIGALYAYLMTRPPVHAQAPADKLRFPFNVRALVAGWNLLFLRTSPIEPDPSKSEAWNRGRYLAEALSHCGACHTPRNALGAESASEPYAGGEAEGWWAPPLDGRSPAFLPWSEENLFNYLRSWDSDHASAAGPMLPVVTNLAKAPESDVRALAVYTASLMSAHRPKDGGAETPPDHGGDPKISAMAGAAIYSGACASCHDEGATWTTRSLALHTAVQAPDPRNMVAAIVGGIKPPEGDPGPFMPPFAGTLDAKQTADVVTYIRARFTDRPAWGDVETTAKQALAGGAK